MKCDLCNPPKVYAEWKIKGYKNWTIYIHPNQSYLGRCFVVLNRHIEDFFDTEKEELLQYFSVVRDLRDAAKSLFKPDMFNYSVLGNDKIHVHLNFVPRYSEPRVFSGFKFVDNRWGSNYSPYDKDFKVPDNVLSDIREALKSRLG